MRHAIPLLIAFTLAGCGGAPLPDQEGAKWTHKELVEHLQAKGLKFTAEPGNGSDRPLMRFAAGGTDYVLVMLCASPQEAKDRGGAYGSSGYVWGRFTFYGTVPTGLLQTIRKTLSP